MYMYMYTELFAQKIPKCCNIPRQGTLRATVPFVLHGVGLSRNLRGTQFGKGKPPINMNMNPDSQKKVPQRRCCGSVFFPAEMHLIFFSAELLLKLVFAEW